MTIKEQDSMIFDKCIHIFRSLLSGNQEAKIDLHSAEVREVKKPNRCTQCWSESISSYTYGDI